MRQEDLFLSRKAKLLTLATLIASTIVQIWKDNNTKAPPAISPRPLSVGPFLKYKLRVPARYIVEQTTYPPRKANPRPVSPERICPNPGIRYDVIPATVGLYGSPT